MEKKKAVIVGIGARGMWSYVEPIVRGHLSDAVELCGIYDAVATRAALVSRHYGGIPVFDDFDAMLDAVKPDFVIVTTKDSDHHEYIIRALEAGYDVISEKPMTNSRKKALAIMEAERRTGHRVLVTFNMRYMKPIEDLKRVVMSGVIGEVRHVDFSWLLDRSHGADYFRRWHRYLDNSTSLLIHKSTHHFDVINWIIGKRPLSVFARCYLEFYGKNGPFRGESCHQCRHTAECPFYYDIMRDGYSKLFFYDVEEESKYHRDGCVFAEDIDIFDRMALSVRYEDDVTMNYSLVAYSPFEGPRFRLVGTKGIAELEWYNAGRGTTFADEVAAATRAGKQVTGEGSMLIRVTPAWGEVQYVRTGFGSGAHGGADDVMRNDLFRTPQEHDELGHVAPSIEGYYSLAIGDMAVLSSRLGREVTIDEIPD